MVGDGEGRWAMVRDGEAERNARTLQIFRFLKISDLEINTPDALRAGGFNRSAHSAGPSLDCRLELSGSSLLTEYQKIIILIDELIR